MFKEFFKDYRIFFQVEKQSGRKYLFTDFFGPYPKSKLPHFADDRVFYGWDDMEYRTFMIATI